MTGGYVYTPKSCTVGHHSPGWELVGCPVLGSRMSQSLVPRWADSREEPWAGTQPKVRQLCPVSPGARRAGVDFHFGPVSVGFHLCPNARGSGEHSSQPFHSGLCRQWAEGRARFRGAEGRDSGQTGTGRWPSAGPSPPQSSPAEGSRRGGGEPNGPEQPWGAMPPSPHGFCTELTRTFIFCLLMSAIWTAPPWVSRFLESERLTHMLLLFKCKPTSPQPLPPPYPAHTRGASRRP